MVPASKVFAPDAETDSLSRVALNDLLPEKLVNLAAEEVVAGETIPLITQVFVAKSSSDKTTCPEYVLPAAEPAPDEVKVKFTENRTTFVGPPS